MTEYMVTGAAERNEIAVFQLKPGFPVEGNDMMGFQAFPSATGRTLGMLG